MDTRDVARIVREGNFERTEDGGIYLPIERALAQGVFTAQIRGQLEIDVGANLVVNEGLDYVLKAAVGETAGIANWYIAPFTGDVTVVGTWTAANFTVNATEWTQYDELTRVQWQQSAVASQGTDSFANKATFTSSADAQVVRGAGLISASAKSATTGTLLAARRFSSDKTLATGEILDIGYGLQLSAV